jgi:hypothetical protein
MSKTLEPNHVEEFLEYVGCYFNGTKPPKLAWDFFHKEQDELQTQLLADPKVLESYLDENPHYVAAALVGRVEIRKNEVSKKLLADYTQVTADQLREAKSLKVEPSLRPLLEAIHPTGKLPKILALSNAAVRLLKLPPHPKS